MMIFHYSMFLYLLFLFAFFGRGAFFLFFFFSSFHDDSSLFQVFFFSFLFLCSSVFVFPMFSFLLFFHFSNFFIFPVVRADAKTRKKSSRSSYCLKRRFSFVKIRFLGLGGQEVRSSPLEGDVAFMFFILFFFPFLFFFENISSFSFFSEFNCGCFLSGGIAGMLGHLLGREHDSTSQSGVEAPRLLVSIIVLVVVSDTA